MTTYNIGDLLTTKDPSPTRYKITGINPITERISMSWWNEHTEAWEDNCTYARATLSRYCIHLHEEIQYDPSQQGDLADDI